MIVSEVPTLLTGKKAMIHSLLTIYLAFVALLIVHSKENVSRSCVFMKEERTLSKKTCLNILTEAVASESILVEADVK